MSFAGRAFRLGLGGTLTFTSGALSYAYFVDSEPIFGGNLMIEEFEKEKEIYEALDWIPTRSLSYLRRSEDEIQGKLYWNKREKEVEGVMYLGKGVEGWPGLVHGGCSATLADTVMGICAMKNRDGGPFLGMTVTANLNVNYRHVIHTGKKVRIRSWVEREEDRKTWVRFEISQQNKTGQDRRVCVEGESLFMTRS